MGVMGLHSSACTDRPRCCLIHQLSAVSSGCESDERVAVGTQGELNLVSTCHLHVWSE